MIRPGVTFSLWLAIAILVVLNDFVGDTWIAATLSVRAVEWYKALVPMPSTYPSLLVLLGCITWKGATSSGSVDRASETAFQYVSGSEPPTATPETTMTR